MGDLSYDDVVKYCTLYSSSKYFLEDCCNKVDHAFGKGTFNNQVQQYLSSGDINIFQEENGVRSYISRLTSDKLEFYLKDCK